MCKLFDLIFCVNSDCLFLQFNVLLLLSTFTIVHCTIIYHKKIFDRPVSCPRLFKSLITCECAHDNENRIGIDCGSRPIQQLPRSWRTITHVYRNKTSELQQQQQQTVDFYSHSNINTFTQSVVYLNLSNTNISSLKSDEFHGLYHLQVLSIENTPLNEIRAHSFRHLTQLDVLRIERNLNLIELNAYSLSDLHNTRLISLTANGIRIIHSEAFRNTHFINKLDLSDNPLEVASIKCKIKSIEPLAFFGFNQCSNLSIVGLTTPIEPQSFSYMIKIKTIDLSNGHVTKIRQYAFDHSEDIGEINLSNSFVKHIEPGAFNIVVNFTSLNLRANLIRHLSRDVFENITAQIIDLNDNPIQCDCSFKWFLKSTTLIQASYLLPDTCAGPDGPNIGLRDEFKY
ncbi:unnamed protein product [Didymodactylos carnosus]|uniref:Uncharacterized protein n=1 Tax=Didymodactylos carnosus TaxID=1234261 RepID=A0A813P085_9BILA|nr:unnamed protein product [Didymodactylos carnosus]CAF3526119.1 unnamed protein product [Didymodactylos carnosus]